MRRIYLNSSKWSSIDDFYNALLPAIGAPKWHGPGINPLIDSIIGGDLNEAEPPYAIVINNTKDLDPQILDHILLAKKHLALSREETRVRWERDVEATIEIIP